jgi:hypothetical protein
MYDEQDMKCKICEKEYLGGRKGYIFDHYHVINVVRGLKCSGYAIQLSGFKW